MMAGFEETSGVEPLASRVAVTMHVPALLAVIESPLILQPFAVPLLTRKLSAPPPGSPFAISVRDDPTWPFSEATDNTGGGTVVVVVVVVVVVDVVAVARLGGGGGGGGGAGVY